MYWEKLGLAHGLRRLSGRYRLGPRRGAGRTADRPPRAARLPNSDLPGAVQLIRGLRELSDGRVLVTDWIEERLVVLDFPSGTFRDIGRIGRGPREFRLPAGLVALPGDERSGDPDGPAFHGDGPA